MLRNAVGTLGLFQYLTVPLLGITAIASLIGERRRRAIAVAIAGIMAALICGGFMFQREYFTSLGL